MNTTDSTPAADRGSGCNDLLGPTAWAVMAFGRVQQLVVRADVADELACKRREQDPNADALPLYARTALDAAVAAERERWIGLVREFVDFLEPMRFDRPSDDAKAAALDEKARALLEGPNDVLGAWVPAHERVPAIGTECVVLVRYTLDRPPFCTVDKWDVQREDPTGMGGPTIETGEGWNDNYESDVIAWIAIPPHPPAEWDQRLPA